MVIRYMIRRQNLVCGGNGNPQLTHPFAADSKYALHQSAIRLHYNSFVRKHLCYRPVDIRADFHRFGRLANADVAGCGGYQLYCA